MEDEIESPSKRRFVETTESERQDLLDSAKRKRTLISTQTWVKAFGAYCGPSTVDFHAISASDLSERLQGFYAGMRKADGSEYKRASFISRISSEMEGSQQYNTNKALQMKTVARSRSTSLMCSKRAIPGS